MVRCRYQDGYLFTRGKKRKMWVARWREGVIQPMARLRGFCDLKSSGWSAKYPAGAMLAFCCKAVLPRLTQGNAGLRPQCRLEHL